MDIDKKFCLERFCDYARFDTQSDPTTGTYPSTEKQIALLLHLKKELETMGLTDISHDGRGVVMATLKGNREGVPVVGFIAHVDTSPEMSGENVRPTVHENYDGGDIVLEHATIKIADNPKLSEHVGEDVITSQGDTLLGADDKAGIAAIMTALRYLMAHPEIPRGDLRVAFTPDEEIGEGTDHFDVKLFNAYCAYTVDGSSRGEIEDETFCADEMTFDFIGHNTHPGSAYKTMINAMKAAGHFLSILPVERSPEGTRGLEGFVHPHTISGGVEKTTIKLILRDFKEEVLEDLKQLLISSAEKAVAALPGARFEYSHKKQYRNMKVILDNYPEVSDIAKQAVREAGLEVIQAPVRGGTDGAVLSFMGLPTPNLFAGAHNFHSRFEWVSLRDMVKSAEVIVRIARLWAERS